ncbi:MAG: hypothetical protein WCJ17_03805, partial [bacterium]
KKRKLIALGRRPKGYGPQVATAGSNPVGHTKSQISFVSFSHSPAYACDAATADNRLYSFTGLPATCLLKLKKA